MTRAREEKESIGRTGRGRERKKEKERERGKGKRSKEFLEIQSLRFTFALRLHHSFTSSAEVLHLHSHTALAESHHTRFRADGLDISTGEVVLLSDELVEVDILIERHLGCVEGEDLLLSVFCRKV